MRSAALILLIIASLYICTVFSEATVAHEEECLAPNFKWAQRKNKVWIKIELPNVHDEEIHLDPNGALHFYGKSELKGSHCYKLHLDLFSTINDVKSTWKKNEWNVLFTIVKENPNWPRLLKTDIKLPNMQIDWTRYPEREEEDDPIELDEEDEEERVLIQKREEKRKAEETSKMEKPIQPKTEENKPKKETNNLSFMKKPQQKSIWSDLIGSVRKVLNRWSNQLFGTMIL
jgi:hypothetical protein